MKGGTKHNFNVAAFGDVAIQEGLAEVAGPCEHHHQAARSAAGGEVHLGQGLGTQPVA